MTFGFRIREARMSAGLKQSELGAKLGVANTTISNWEKDVTQPSLEMIELLCGALDVSPNALISTRWSQAATPASNSLSPSAHRVGRANERATPLVKRTVGVALEPYMDEQIIYVEFSQSEQKASAGTGVFLSDESMVTLSVRLDALPKGYERDPNRYFGVPVSGDSMEPKYRDGDILIVSKEPLNMGDIGIVIMDGEGYVKKIGSGVLCSLNPAYDDIPITESVLFCGKVVGTLEQEAVKT